MRRRWRLRPHSEAAAETLVRELGVAPLIARLLSARGVEAPERAHAFLNAQLSEHLRSPMLFQQMPKAADRVVAALDRGERIGIYGDYDVDGMSGSALLVRFFRALGHEPDLFIPRRMVDGYGLTQPGIDRLAGAGVKLMITVDCGGVAHREIAHAARRGMDTIVCDHHQVSEAPLPAHAVINPIEPDAGFPFRGLCGTGVALYLTLGTRMRLREAGRQNLPDLRRSLDLVTLGTIADVVPLVEENRVLVRAGLREILQSAMPGIVALKRISRVEAVSASAIGYRMAPRLNAAGRLSDATRAVELLTTLDTARAEQIARELDDENRARRAIEAEMLEDALQRLERDPEQAQRRSIVLADEDWHPGVVGIIAARLVERFHRPSVVIALDRTTGVGRGSGRSIPGLNLHEAFRRASAFLQTFGGHHMAAGLSLSGDALPDFAERFEEAVHELTQQSDFVAETLVDAELELGRIDDSLLDALASLEPYGSANPEPVFLIRAAHVAGCRVVAEQHLKLYLKQPGGAHPAIGFGLAGSGIEQGSAIDVLVTPERSEWQGRTSIELRIRDWRATRSA